MTETHLEVFERRVRGEKSQMVKELMLSYGHLKHFDERQQWIFHWPSSSSSSEPRKIVHHPLRRIQREEEEEYFYYDFIHQHALKKVNEKKRLYETHQQTEQQNQMKRIRETQPHVMVTVWRNPISLRQLEQLFEPDSSPLPLTNSNSVFNVTHKEFPFHKKKTWISGEKYKLSFTLQHFRLKLSSLTNSILFLVEPGDHHVMTSIAGCQILVNDPRFKSLTIYLESGKFHEIYSLKEPLSLSDIASGGDGKTCYIHSRYPFTLMYWNQPSTMVLKTEGQCFMDLSFCHMEYWTACPEYAPIRYTIADVDYLTNISNMARFGINTEKRVLDNKPLPQRYEFTKPRIKVLFDETSPLHQNPLPGFHDAMQRFNLVRELKVQWIKELPYFFYYGKPLGLTQNRELIYDGMTIASFSSCRKEKRINFQLIYSEQSRSVGYLDYLVY